MRYDNWDVILFPRESHVPIQEFKTACYVARDEYNHALPTLTCYITSLPQMTPFRISIHSWAIPTRPSAIIETAARKKRDSRVIWTIQAFVDGGRVFHGFHEVGTRWPQEISHEQRSLASLEKASSQRKRTLEFPPFHHNILSQSSWDVHDHNGRIEVVLSEQLMKNSGNLDIEVCNEIVCFSFQHAPRDILEQTGISWPIRNPLYFPHIANDQPKTHSSVLRGRVRSPLLHPSERSFAFTGSQNSELYGQTKTDLPPQFSQFPKPPTKTMGLGCHSTRADIWDKSFTESYEDTYDDISMMDSWSTKQSTSKSTADNVMSPTESLFPIKHTGNLGQNWNSSTTQYERGSSNRKIGDNTRRRDENERQLLVALREDQLGQLIEAISPPKKSRPLDRGLGGQWTEQDHTRASQTCSRASGGPPRATGLSINPRPSAAALARKSSYADLNSYNSPHPQKSSPDRTVIHKIPCQPCLSSKKENQPPSVSMSRLSTPHSLANRVLTPNPFVPIPGTGQKMSTGRYIWDEDVEMRDPSSMFSSLSRFGRRQEHTNLRGVKTSPAPIPSTSGSLKSRKEGITMDHIIRHDKSLLPDPVLDFPTSNDRNRGKVSNEHDHFPHNLPIAMASPDIHSNFRVGNEDNDVLIIDPSLGTTETHQKDFMPGHQKGLCSVDSTSRLERQLFSALGEELGNFNTMTGDHTHTDPSVVGSELVQAFGLRPTEGVEGGAAEVTAMVTGKDDNTTKRKRQGTFDGERDRSPMAKAIRNVGEEKSTEEVRQEHVPQLRDD